MGHKFSVIKGVKSGDFYKQGNAINEIWVGDFELISRLPFGDSDIGQAGWPPGNWPKIPWHQSIIPLKRDLNTVQCTSLECRSNLIAKPSAACEDPVTLIYPGLLLLLLLGDALGIVSLVVKYRRSRLSRVQYLETAKEHASSLV
jgi:hypothetical protein